MRKGSVLSRMAALLLLLLCITLVAVVLVEPLVREHRTLDTLIADSQDQLDRFAAHRQDLKALQSKLEKQKRTRVAQSSYLKERTSSLAAAALLGRIKQTVQRHGGTLASSQVLQSGEKTEKPRVTIRADMKVTPKALQQILHQLESAQPALFVENVLITGRIQKKTLKRRNEVVQSWDELTLDVQYDVTGFLRTETPG